MIYVVGYGDVYTQKTKKFWIFKNAKKYALKKCESCLEVDITDNKGIRIEYFKRHIPNEWR